MQAGRVGSQQEVVMESFKPSFDNRWNRLRMSLLAVLMAAGTAATAAETVKIYRSTMPDGSVVLSDRPASGARAVASHSYVLKAPKGAAEAERDYWRRQSDAFNLRQQQQDVQEPRRRMSPLLAGDAPSHEDAWLPVAVYPGHHASRPIVPGYAVPRHYGSSPGAVRGRSSGFIGSGFSTSR